MTTASDRSCAAGEFATGRRWPVERALFAMAGTAVLVASLLTVLVSPWFLLLAAFVGLNQWLYVIAGDCPASLILTRLFGLTRGIPR